MLYCMSGSESCSPTKKNTKCEVLRIFQVDALLCNCNQPTVTPSTSDTGTSQSIKTKWQSWSHPFVPLYYPLLTSEIKLLFLPHISGSQSWSWSSPYNAWLHTNTLGVFANELMSCVWLGRHIKCAYKIGDIYHMESGV